MLTRYLRKEPTTDAVLLAEVAKGHVKLGPAHMDVVAYEDKECTQPCGRWPWYYKSKPTRRNKIITLNCYKWLVEWIDAAARQFPEASTMYGAPMGRKSYGRPGRSIRLFRVRINAGGYDDGGAYWGTGTPLYCATDGEDYQEFVRAWTRDDARAALGLTTDQLKRGK